LDSAKAPFLTYEDINAKAREVHVACGYDKGTLVDIEAIVEFQYSIDVVPVRGLKDDYSVDGFLALSFTQIFVDESILERHPTRYRFTLAHELGHRILHADIFRDLQITTTEEWVRFYLGLDDYDYGWFERQAYWFAGAILVPEESLIAEYQAAADKIRASGLEDADLSQNSRTQLAGALAKRFFVSTAVMQKRLGEIGIW
jgi:hypothetical protein